MVGMKGEGRCRRCLVARENGFGGKHPTPSQQSRHKGRTHLAHPLCHAWPGGRGQSLASASLRLVEL